MTQVEATVPVAVAVDVGGTGIKCALVDAFGQLRHTERHPTGRERGPVAVVATILDVAAGLAKQAAAAGLTPVAAGVVVPGIVDEERGVAEWSANLGLRSVRLRDLLATRLDLPTALGHDVRAGAIAEARLGAGRGARRMLFVAIGTGIAAAYTVEGRIDAGAHGGSGELGHVAIRSGPDALRCGCGGRGCLEAYASAAAIEAAGGGTAKELLQRASEGEPRAKQVWAVAVDALADGLLTATALFDPEVIVLGGGLAEAGPALVDPLASAMAARRTFHRLPRLTRAGLGDAAGCQGAALLAHDLVEGPGR
jgi:glucokinase